MTFYELQKNGIGKKVEIRG